MGVGPLLLALVLQTSGAPDQSTSLPVSIERVREGLERPGRFRLPPPRPWRRPLFTVKVEQRALIFEDLWKETSPTPPWVRPTMPVGHFDFLASVTPAEVRSATLHPCCPATPVIGAVSRLVGKGVRALKERRARREVEAAMKAAGIRK